jgi:hypothetical protein
MVEREISYSHAHALSFLKTCLKVGFAKMQDQFPTLELILEVNCYDDLSNVARGGSTLGQKLRFVCLEVVLAFKRRVSLKCQQVSVCDGALSKLKNKDTNHILH